MRMKFTQYSAQSMSLFPVNFSIDSVILFINTSSVMEAVEIIVYTILDMRVYVFEDYWVDDWLLLHLHGPFKSQLVTMARNIIIVY